MSLKHETDTMHAPSKAAVGLAVTAAVAVLRLAGLGVVRETDQRLLDLKFRLRGPATPATATVLVAIDQKSLQKIGGWPWPRERVGDLVRAISAGGAKVIGLDLVFSEPSRDPRSDGALAGALEAAGNAVPGALFYISPGEGGFQTQAEYEENLARLEKARVNIIRSMDPGAETLKILTAYGALANMPAVSRASRGEGYYNVVPERDGCIRYAPLVLQASGRVYHSLAVALARAVWGAGNVELITEGGYVRMILLHAAGGRAHEVPVDRLGRLCINYYGKDRFPSFRASEVLAGAVPPGAFRGRVVLVGGTSLGDFDMAGTPVHPAMPSIELQATVLDNILGDRALVTGYPAMAFTWLFILVPGVALSLFLPRFRGMAGGALLALGLFLSCALADFLLFARHQIVIESVYPLAAVSLGYAAMQAYGYALLARDVRRLGQGLSGVNEAAAARLDIDRFLPAVLRFLVTHLGARRGLILTAREGALRWAEGQVPGDRAVFHRLDRDAFSGPGFSLERDLMRQAVGDGAPRLAGRTPRGCEAGSITVVPLARSREVTGLVCLDSGADGARLSTDELKILAALAPPLRMAIENAWLYSDLRQEKELLHDEVAHLRRGIDVRDRRFKGIIGDSPAIREVYSLIEKAAASSIGVLIEGETGTGKELVARAIHSLGERSARVMVTQNCAALPEQLLESELFGHTRGAFTGAVSDKKGLFEIADGGTMFLDEIGDAPPSVQAKLLRVLQEGMIRPIGGVREKKVDVRILSATNKNLEEEVHKGAFREDLYYRLNAFQVRVPPLRERREDIPLLAGHFLDTYSREMNKTPRGFSSSAFALLYGYDYPGNIRELENLVQRAVAMTPGGELVHPDVFPDKIRGQAGLHKAAVEGGEVRPLKEALEIVERQLVTAALQRHGNNRTAAAAELGITRSGLRLVMKRLGLLNAG